MKLYIYEDRQVQLVQLANKEPKDYRIKKQNERHIVYEKEGCLDVIYLPVSDLNKAYQFLTGKMNQTVLKQHYDTCHPTWFVRVVNYITRWIPFLRNY